MINLFELQHTTCSGLEVAAVLLAALCHDLDHDGLSNSFHVRSKSALATCYSYHSVLEQHHTAMAKKLLKDTGCLDALNEKEHEKVTGLMKRCIFATDMGQHKQQLNTLVSWISHRLPLLYSYSLFHCFFFLQKLFSPASETWSVDRHSRHLVLATIVHSADLFTPWKSFKFGAQWLSRFQQEQRRQTILETSLGLKASLKPTDEAAFIQDEIYFLGPISLDWFSALIRLFPQAACLRADTLRVMNQWQTCE